MNTVDILLVDDEARNLDALEATLEDPSYRLLRADSAEKALKTLLDHDVAAIVLDIKMPGVSGVELARMIKNTKRFRETPIVFLTAYMLDDQDVIAGYGAGAVDYLTKPVHPKILRHKVAVFADLYRKTRELATVNAELAGMNEKLEARVKERTAELEKSEAALRAAAKQKDEFLAVLAHELRNPLAPMRTGLDLLLRQKAAGGPALDRTLAAMNRQLEHMVRLIDDLLDVSRISRGLLELKRSRVDLVALARSTVEGARSWFERRKQTVSVDLPSEIFAHADATRVAQILTNLLHNAAKFTPEGGSIHVELVREADDAVIRVTDTGSGIRADQLERVFDMFARVERPGIASESGLGIGLALARRLAEMHGGSLSVVSAGENRGATFTLRVPALFSVAPDATAAVNGTPAATGSVLDIAVVEDNDDIADVLAEWLGELGHTVRIGRTGGGGVQLVRERVPDVVICDLGLPDIDGMEVCRQVRKLPLERQPVMIALTGWGREDDVRSTRAAGFEHHLVKPVATDKLEGLLGKIGESRAARALEPQQAGAPTTSG
jgi:signal transduction histidine kinase